jgi:hypothetical protein
MLLLAVLLAAMAAYVKHSPRQRRLAFALSSIAVLLVLGGALTGCGGGSSGGPVGPTPTGGTAAGSYTITVTATAGSGANAVGHTITLALTVQ